MLSGPGLWALKEGLIDLGWGPKMPKAAGGALGAVGDSDSDSSEEDDDTSDDDVAALDAYNQTGHSPAPKAKQTHLLHPRWGVTTAMDGMSAGMNGLLKPFGVMIQRAQYTGQPIAHLMARQVDEMVKEIESGFVDNTAVVPACFERKYTAI